MKVRKGSTYRYAPCLLDLVHRIHEIPIGTRVRVIHPHGCPRPNTMNHCHVESLDGRFLGLVCCASLTEEERS
jgi:hypothetical protein